MNKLRDFLIEFFDILIFHSIVDDGLSNLIAIGIDVVLPELIFELFFFPLNISFHQIIIS